MPDVRRVYRGQIVDLVRGAIFPGEVAVKDGKIEGITRVKSAPMVFITPGLIDSHGHIESSKVVPWEYMRMAVRYGVVGFVNDPHEIANVCGVPGIDWMLDNAFGALFHFWFGAPSCVPASPFETAGAVICPDTFGELIRRPELRFGAEFMDFPGVNCGRENVLAKLAHCRAAGKPIDGHVLGYSLEELQIYRSRGPSTNHEATTFEEGRDNITAGIQLLIREGGAAKDFDALIGLLPEFPGQVMFCCDDIPASRLRECYLDYHVRRAIGTLGLNSIDVLRAASLNPARHYGIPVGMLQVGDRADFVIVSDLANFAVQTTVLGGEVVFDQGEVLIAPRPVEPINCFNREQVLPDFFRVPVEGDNIRVIKAIDGKLVTEEEIHAAEVEDGHYVSCPGRDLLKMAVIDRYDPTRPPSFGFIRGIGIKRGAVASTVVHDGHHLLVIGCTDEEMAAAANALIRVKGGYAVASGDRVDILPLPIAGLMSAESGEFVCKRYLQLAEILRALGTTLGDPLMTISFMGLTVIGKLKLGNLGLVRGATEIVSLAAK